MKFSVGGRATSERVSCHRLPILHRAKDSNCGARGTPCDARNLSLARIY
jgi:hypothetical protein